jgi:hypothetical protein
MSIKNYTKEVVRGILHTASEFEWSLQGFGMLRLYLPNGFRLHVWDKRFAVENVSLVHTHPWGFKSTIIAGTVYNTRLAREEASPYRFYEQKILCGEGGGLREEPKEVGLKLMSYETYREGQSYEQESDEIHISIPVDGSVTIIERTFKEDRDHASVFWNVGERFVSAEPREARKYEVEAITGYALKTFFNQP